jgi:hypothetical protein
VPDSTRGTGSVTPRKVYFGLFLELCYLDQVSPEVPLPCVIYFSYYFLLLFLNFQTPHSWPIPFMCKQLNFPQKSYFSIIAYTLSTTKLEIRAK